MAILIANRLKVGDNIYVFQDASALSSLSISNLTLTAYRQDGTSFNVALPTETTLTTASNTVLPTSKAVADYVAEIEEVIAMNHTALANAVGVNTDYSVVPWSTASGITNDASTIKSGIELVASSLRTSKNYGLIKAGASSSATTAPTINTNTISANSANEVFTILPSNKWIGVGATNSGTAGSDTFSIGHVLSGVTAGSYGESAAKSPGFSGTFSVPYITIDAAGHASAASGSTITLPANPITENINNGVIAVGTSNNNKTVKSSGVTITTTSPSGTSGDSTVPTSKAVHSAINTALASALIYQGTVSSSASLPASPKVGDVYVAGTNFSYGTLSIETGDMFIYNKQSGWDIIQGENLVTNNTSTYTLPSTAGSSSTFLIGNVDGTNLDITLQTPSGWKLTDEKQAVSSTTSTFYVSGITSTPNGAAVTGVANTNVQILGGNKIVAPNSSVATATVTGTATIANANITTATVTNATITTGTISTANITNATVTTATVTGASITTGTISTATITNGTITTATVTNGTLTNATVTGTATLSKANIGTATISTASITNATITAATVTGATITTGTISTALITTINGVTVGNSPKFTDEKVALYSNADNSEYAMVFRNVTTASGDNTDYVKYNNNVIINPSTKTVTNKSGAFRVANSTNTEGCNMIYNAITKTIDFQF